MEHKPLAGHAALVTGASRGIGRAVALMLAREGCNVALIGRHAEALHHVQRECEAEGVRALALAVDLAERAMIASAVDACEEAFGGLNILVNNAGIHRFASAVDADLELWDRMVDVNLRAAMHATRLALPYIVAGTRAGQRGAVVFISSLGGKFTAPTNAGYAATKHALTGFGGSVFEDVRDHGVKVCVIYPGWTNTGLLADWLDPREVIQPEDVAAAVRFVIHSAPTVCPTEIVLQPQSSRAAKLFGEHR
ncbi:MAG: SDR family oxidoreductase [Anaerolineae bacterium]|nr:SDR family oxidoreductase [Anaerolineae bacterium]MDW8291708.1 SDR family oxidoreductase [Anaerolineae bacterium]